MAKTRIRASQIRSYDITDSQLANSAVLPNNISAAPSDITSSNGVITLTNVSNSFIVDGTEIITKIDGILNGIVALKWKTDRSLTHTSGTLELNKNVNRNVCAGDISLFVIRNGVAEEIGYKTSVEEQQSKIYEFIAVAGQVDFIVDEAPQSKNNVLLTVNGLLQKIEDYSVASKTITLSSACEVGDEVTIIVLQKTLVQSEAGVDVIDGGTF